MRSPRREPQIGIECGASGFHFSERVPQHHTEKVLTRREIRGRYKQQRKVLSGLFELSQGDPRSRHHKPEGTILRVAHEVRLGVSQGRAGTIRVQANPNEKVHCASFRKASRHRRDGILLGSHRIPESLALFGKLVEFLSRDRFVGYLRCADALAAARSAKDYQAQQSQ